MKMRISMIIEAGNYQLRIDSVEESAAMTWLGEMLDFIKPGYRSDDMPFRIVSFKRHPVIIP